MEAFSIEIISKNSKNILIRMQYRHLSSKGEIFEEKFKNLTKPKQEINQSILSAT